MLQLVLMPAAAATAIRLGGYWGHVTVRASAPDLVAAVVALSQGNEATLPMELTPRNHFLSTADYHQTGRWYRVDADLNVAWLQARIRAGAAVPQQALEHAVTSGLYRGPHLAITYAPDLAARYPGLVVPDFVAWHVDDGWLIPMDVQVEPAVLGMQQLEPAWPAGLVADMTAMVVGAGSIGASAAVALATYGVGRLLLVDDDRLLWHNLVRHVGGARDVGRFKVDALAAQLRELRADTAVEAFRVNAVDQADIVRGHLGRTDIVVCAADGVAPRRVISHLSRRAHLPAVLACVLDDGGIGEVLRLQPYPDHGCLLCNRAHLVAAGAFDPEGSLDAEYTTGTRHRPMTAVGSDLHLVGQLAAKVTVATYLQRKGQADQHLPGEHAVLGLRPRPGRSAPFDVTEAGKLAWHPAWQPIAGCPSCGLT